jgi:L-asparaginase
MNKDSLEMTQEDRIGLVAEMSRLLPEGHPFVITHGTDTMVETGLYLQRTFPSLHVPVVLTGAMTPLGFEGSDGLQNLTESLMASRLLGPGVYIVMHGRVFPADHVRKDRDLGTFVETTQSVNPGGSE